MNKIYRTTIALIILIGFGIFSNAEESSQEDAESQKAWEEKLQEIREANERRREKLESSDDPFQLKGLSLEELYQLAEQNRYPSSSDKFGYIIKELSNRPEQEVKAIINQQFSRTFDSSKDRRAVEKFFSIPYIARAGGKEFQVETIKKLFDHPRMTKIMAIGLIEVSGLMEIVASSEKDQNGFIDHLIEKGYIEAGSKMEAKWRKEFSTRTSPESRPTPVDIESSPNVRKDDAVVKPSIPEQSSVVWPFYLAGGALALAFIGYFLSKRR